MKFRTFATTAAVTAALIGFVSSATAGSNCRALSSVAACTACKLEQKGHRYGPGATNDWCAKVIGQNAGQRAVVKPAGFNRRAQ